MTGNNESFPLHLSQFPFVRSLPKGKIDYWSVEPHQGYEAGMTYGHLVTQYLHVTHDHQFLYNVFWHLLAKGQQTEVESGFLSVVTRSLLPQNSRVSTKNQGKV